MKGESIKLLKFMEGYNKRFVIPVYQRNYDWKLENCKQLFDDLVKTTRNQRKSHFFGSIVSVFNPDGEKEEHQIIDGQQRLTTTTLLLLALRNLIQQGLVSVQNEKLSRLIFKEYLIDSWEPEDTQVKLKPVKNDRIAFNKLFESEDQHVVSSNLTSNYNYFYKRIQENELTPDELFDAVRRLEIISITLNHEDDPQLIFESLNSTGLALTEGDKVRNFVLMGQSPKRQENFYDNYWDKIAQYVNNEIDVFIRDYLSVKTQTWINLGRVYLSFKKYYEEKNLEIEELLKDLTSYARRYEILLGKKVGFPRFDVCLSRLNRLETTIVRPFFMEILRLKEENILSLDEVANIAELVESYIFRRNVCDVPSNALSKIFLTLHKDVLRFDTTTDDYYEKVKYILLSKKENARFPGDEEFSEAFQTKPLYLKKKLKDYVLERLENHDTLEDKDIYRHLEDGTYSIEHVMPQHLSTVWIEQLGDDYEEIHNQWIHRIANLTLTAYNSSYSNHPFEQKRDMQNGFKMSGIRMNQWIAQQERWGLAELEQRSELLREQALTIWVMPTTSYQPPSAPQHDSFTLEDDVDPTGKKIASFTYQRAEESCTTWADMFEKVVRRLHNENPAVLHKLAQETSSGGLSVYVSADPDSLRESLEIESNLYVERNTNTTIKINILRSLFALYDVQPTELVFYLKDDETELDEATQIKHDRRRRFWSFVTPILKEVNPVFPYFDSAPSSQNVKLGCFGIGGFYIAPVANVKNARVEMRLSHSNAKRNAQSFERLLTHKDEIEKELGVELVWDEGVNTKVAKIYYQLDDVSIENEDDWEKMARFQAEWSAKFYAAMVVPYLKPMFETP